LRQNIFGLFIGVLIAGLASVRAENSSVAPDHTTPAGLVRQALANNPELKFYTAEIAAAKGTLKTAGTMRNPELNTEAGYKNTRDNSGGPSGQGATWSVSVNQTFEYPGRIALRKAIAKGDVNLALATQTAGVVVRVLVSSLCIQLWISHCPGRFQHSLRRRNFGGVEFQLRIIRERLPHQEFGGHLACDKRRPLPLQQQDACNRQKQY
jgi:hypothetical protein